MKLHTYKGFEDIDIAPDKEQDIMEVLQRIKTGGDEIEEIEIARQIVSKRGKSSKSYKAMKGELTQTTWNFRFHTKKVNKNIVEPTGFLYIDVDLPGFEITSVPKELIFSFFKSLSGKGYGIVVKVFGLTLENYETTYNNIALQLGLSGVFDKGAKKATQYNTLSYDPNLYLNPDSFQFTAFEPEIQTKTKEQKTSAIRSYTENSPKPTLLVPNCTSLTKVNYETRLDNYQGLDFVEIPEGKLYSTVFIGRYRKIPVGKLNNALLRIISTLLYNNPGISRDLLYNHTMHLNKTYAMEPAKVEDIFKKIDWCMNKEKNGQLKVHGRLRYSWANPDSKLTGKEKKTKANEGMCKRKVANTKKKIHLCIESCSPDQKNVPQFIADNTGLSLRTVKTYYYQIKKEKNDTTRPIKDTQGMEANQHSSLSRDSEGIQPVHPTNPTTDNNRPTEGSTNKTYSPSQRISSYLAGESEMGVLYTG